MSMSPPDDEVTAFALAAKAGDRASTPRSVARTPDTGAYPRRQAT